MEEFLALRPKQWNLLVFPRQYRDRLLVAMAQLAITSPLIVLDCGRQYDPSVVIRAAYGRREIADQIKIRRAFICSEAVKLLERTTAGNTPVIVLDFLSTFYDENVKIYRRRYLLESALGHFQRLCQGAGLAVTVHAPSPHDDFYLYERLRSSASRVSEYEIPVPPDGQLGLF